MDGGRSDRILGAEIAGMFIDAFGGRRAAWRAARPSGQFQADGENR